MGEVGDSLTASVSSSRDSSGALTLTIVGELDIASVGAVDEAIDEYLSDDSRRVVFDLGGLTFMDSTGLALMLQVSKKVDTIEIHSATPIVRRVIEATGLKEILGLQS
jgi:anti-sigma B factor antagonist